MRRPWRRAPSPRTEHGLPACDLAAAWLKRGVAFTTEPGHDGLRMRFAPRQTIQMLELGYRVTGASPGLPRETVDDIIARSEARRGFVPFVDYVREVSA